jgi:alginate O-acetyltransferase complex protein AlgI
MLLIGSIFVNYWLGQLIHQRTKKTPPLFMGVAFNLLTLFYFKYIGFFTAEVLGLSFAESQLPDLPLGISFFTFQAISYLVDVYRKQAQPAESVQALGLYIAMFPQLVAGPIVRYASIAQAINNRTITLSDITSGAGLFIIGLSQKLILADKMALVADTAFAFPNEQVTAISAWSGVSAYTLQIYFDFSAYSLMAIGLGRLMGFTLPPNFNYPYAATSLTEFWRRWHISLSTWFRDYVYIPLGGNRLGAVRTYLNLIIVFTLCGLWHGAAWNFLIWGYFHGIMLVLERIGLSRILHRIPKPLAWAYTMLMVMCAWVLFRSEDLAQSSAFLRAMFGLGAVPDHSIYRFFGGEALILFPIAIIGSFPLARYVVSKFEQSLPLVQRSLTTIWIGLLTLLCLVLVMSGGYSPFIYFRF